jgi:hypothetical protein
MALLQPYPHASMRVYPIGSAIGNVKNDGPELIEPAGPDLLLGVRASGLGDPP